MDEVQTVKVKLQPLHNSYTLVLVLSVQKENFNLSEIAGFEKHDFEDVLKN